jgi:radical SAM protein with 4Fe4S-binding SPASM domain
MPEPFADLTVEQVERVVAQIPRLERAVLHGVGEPLLHKGLAEILEVVKRRGAYALFNTNGTIMPERSAEALVGGGLDELRVSIDAASAPTYLAVRGADFFDRIWKSLAVVAQAKERSGRAVPRLSLWMTGLWTNVRELPALVRLAARAGIAEVYLQRLVTSGRGMATLDESLFRRQDAHAVVAEAEEVARSLGVALRGSGDTTGLGSLAGPSAEAPWRACQRPWRLVYVTANGNVLPCCIAPFTAAPYGSYVLGNAFESSLAEIWNGERYRNWRAAMLDGEPNEACRRCGADWSL